MKNLRELLNTEKINKLDNALLLSFCLKKPKEFLYTHPEYIPSCWQRLKLLYCLRLYRRGFPIAYITGRKEFYGLDFLVNKNVLVPRPDTELMVEEAVKIINNDGTEKLLIDIGTGSGCIPIAILKNIKQTLRTVAIDVSRAALRVAQKNADKHGVKIDFIKGSLLSRLIRKDIFSDYSSIVITANLPYLTLEQFRSEPSIQREPLRALVAQDNGLELYKKLISQITNFGKQYPKVKVTLLMEIDPRQKELMAATVKNMLPGFQTKIKTDLAGRDRLVIINS